MSEAVNTVGGVRTVPGGMSLADVAIRPMEERDIPRAVEIESAIMGPKKSTTLRGSLTAYLAKGEQPRAGGGLRDPPHKRVLHVVRAPVGDDETAPRPPRGGRMDDAPNLPGSALRVELDFDHSRQHDPR